MMMALTLAWLKIINNKFYKKYSYSVLMEGSIFTNRYVLNDTLNFMKRNNSDFVSTDMRSVFFHIIFRGNVYKK